MAVAATRIGEAGDDLARPGIGRFASVFSGCGGLDLGFVQAGFDPLWANDIDPVAVATHDTLVGGMATAGDLLKVEWPDPGTVDIVIGGPPCQGFSVAGRMNPSDPRSRHVLTFFDFVDHVGPRAFVLENVKALAVSDRWTLLRERLRSRAEAMGYSTALHVLHAADYGVPQRRERMFLIGVRGSLPPKAIPSTTTTQATVREALEQLPPYSEPGNDTFCSACITPARRPVMRPTAYRGSLLFNGNGRPLRLDAVAHTLPASMGGNATPIVDQRELETGEESWVVAYHKHLFEGGAPYKRVPGHLRRITVEEAAALQSFPSGAVWAGTTSARFRQIGNAVPPRLAYHVALAVAECMKLGRVSHPEAAAAVA